MQKGDDILRLRDRNRQWPTRRRLFEHPLGEGCVRIIITVASDKGDVGKIVGEEL